MDDMHCEEGYTTSDVTFWWQCKWWLSATFSVTSVSLLTGGTLDPVIQPGLASNPHF